MSKTNTILNYINKCEELKNSNNIEEIEAFIEQMIAVYGNEIKGFTDNLASRSMIRMYEKISIEEAKEDLNKIKMILQNYRENIKSGLVNTRNSHGLTIQNNLSSTAISNVNISLDQIIKNINHISDKKLSSDEKEELEDKLRSLESIVNEGDKDKIESKLKKIFDFALSKGPEVIALVSSGISLLTDKILPLFK